MRRYAVFHEFDRGKSGSTFVAADSAKAAVEAVRADLRHGVMWIANVTISVHRVGRDGLVSDSSDYEFYGEI